MIWGVVIRAGRCLATSRPFSAGLLDARTSSRQGDGQPFIDHWSDWATLVAELPTSDLLLQVERWYLLPIFAAVNGDRSTAEEMVRAELTRVGDAPDAYSAAYRDFATRFFAHDW